MDWLMQQFSSESLLMVVGISIMIAVFVVASIRSHKKHLARIERIKHGFDPNIK